jgi:hypothetical protein
MFFWPRKNKVKKIKCSGIIQQITWEGIVVPCGCASAILARYIRFCCNWAWYLNHWQIYMNRCEYKCLCRGTTELQNKS